ncbi:Tryptophan--tRNA ligase, mitochondrial [Tulasnella sp. UAMH 9824]|nr:Tryptophan--tRNA ligase, mitochondrial [Tulasnella sp. UAMH 9824]
MPQDPKVLREDRLNSLACLLAVGIDPKRSILFLQDQIPEHAELAWILNCITPMGKLQRMTTWKSKLAVSRNANSEDEVSDSLLNLGLFAYPVLQTADILLYKATHVPVGEDQQQHLELSRDLADLFNRTQKTNIFPLPQHIITPAKRILSLRDPTQKMSKSAPNPKSRILITDNYSQIQAKVRSAVTDSTPSISYDPENRPGVANLLTILASCSDSSKSVAELAQEYSSKNHAELKADVTEAVERLVGPIRENYRRIRNDEAWLRQVSNDGIRRAREIATQTMDQVKHQIGLGPL